MTPYNILLYSKISALCSHHQRSSLTQRTGTDAQTHSQTLCRERVLGTYSFKCDVSITSLSSGKLTEEEEEERM